MKNSFIQVNKKLIIKLGVDVAVLYSVLLDNKSFASSRNRLYDDGYFHVSVDRLKSFTGYCKKTQNKLLLILEKNKLIKIAYFGMPKRRFIKVL